MGERARDGRPGKAERLRCLRNGDERLGLEKLVEAQRGRGGTPEAFNCPAVLVEQRQDPPRRIGGLTGGFHDTRQEEIEPTLPVAGLAHGLEALVIGVAVGLEIKAEIEERAAQHALLAEEQRDKQPPEPAVAVEERVDGLELYMSEPRLHEDGNLRRSRVQEPLEIAHASPDLARRRRHEGSIARPRAADPVLAAAKLAGLAPFASPAGEQDAVDLAQP